jgi:MoxR-like ATPase
VTPEIGALLAALEAAGYIAEPATATAVFLARATGKPLLIEGDAGVGKTELAKVLAGLLGTELIRLQCYEGLDVQTALYEWDYPRQMLRLRISESRGETSEQVQAQIFSREYLLERPLLRAITRHDRPPVLLIDEIDRADDGFEAFLLELLSDFQVTIPELGTIKAEHPPHVVLTSNRTRELGDALRRRCLYLYLDHPSLEREVRIIEARCPEATGPLPGEIARFMQALRERRLVKPPGVAETLDFARALTVLRQASLEPEVVAQTLGCLLKDKHDIDAITPADVAALVARARQAAAP